MRSICSRIGEARLQQSREQLAAAEKLDVKIRRLRGVAAHCAAELRDDSAKSGGSCTRTLKLRAARAVGYERCLRSIDRGNDDRRGDSDQQCANSDRDNRSPAQQNASDPSRESEMIAGSFLLGDAHASLSLQCDCDSDKAGRKLRYRAESREVIDSPLIRIPRGNEHCASRPRTRIVAENKLAARCFDFSVWLRDVRVPQGA